MVFPFTETKALQGLKNAQSLSVCPGSKEHCRPEHEPRDVLMLSGIIWCGKLESGVSFPRTRMVARQPVDLDCSGRVLAGVLRGRELGSEVRLPQEPIGRPGTDGNRSHAEIIPLFWFKGQLKSCILVSYRSCSRECRYRHLRTSCEWRPEGVPTND